MPTPILATKLYLPPPRPKVVSRPRLIRQLNGSVGLHRKLTLISAPAGFGKTTLVSDWVASTSSELRVLSSEFSLTDQTQPFKVAWLSLDEGDSDPVRFLTYLVAALRTVTADVGEGVLGILQSPQPPPVESILTALLNEISSIPENLVLVLDDYHVVDAKAVDHALTFLIEHMPPQMHLVITTREDPQLPLARLRARHQLTELRVIDLRFTPSEAAGFLNQAMSLDLSAEDIDALERRTEGWVAGLQLAAISLQGHRDTTGFIKSFTGSSRFVIDYLAEEVLERQPEEVRVFLLRTSVLERMCAPLCDAVLNRNSEAVPAAGSPQLISSQAMLEKLERSNLFIVPLDDERRWYRYHPLFADLLRQRLHRWTNDDSSRSAHRPTNDEEGARGPSSFVFGPSSVQDLHIRASQWYGENGLEIEAFQHAAAANDVERAERLIEGDGVPLHFRGAGAPVLNWLESLPPAVLNARPWLWVTYASALMMTGQHTAVEQKLQAAEAALQGSLQGGESNDKPQDLVGRIASMRATLAVIRQDARTIIAQSRRALDYLHPDNLPLRTAANLTLGYAYQLQGDRAAAGRAYSEVISISKSFGDSIYTTAATLCLGQVQETENRLRLAAETYRRALLLAGDPPRPIACEAHLGLARIYYQWNDLDAAEQHGLQCLLLTRQMESVDTFASYGVFLARLRLAQGDLAGAIATLEEAEEFVRRHNFVFRMPDIAAAQVLTLLRQGHLHPSMSGVPSVLRPPGPRTIALGAGSGPFAEAAQLAETYELPISQARVLLAQGDPAAALGVLEPLEQQMEARGWADELLKVMVLQAVALRAHGEKEKAVQLLGEALALAEPEGYVRIFVDEGMPMAQLLLESAARGIMPHYTGKLMSAFEAEKPTSEGNSHLPLAAAAPLALASSAWPLIEPLSQRELEVLQLMAQGLSNHDISRRLFLALSTVKGHNRIIFGKLQVQRRTEAVARAHELGLLDRAAEQGSAPIHARLPRGIV